MKRKILLFILVASLMLTGCAHEYNSALYQKEMDVKLVDSTATKETVTLYGNLKKLADSKIIFGHHDDTAYGVGWKGNEGHSDVKDIVNSYPGLYGWDFSWALDDRWDSVFTNHPIIKLVKEAYYRGGINVFCWHYGNPVTQQNFYDTTIAVRKIIPGGGYYLRYLRDLDRVADFIEQLKDSTGKPIPVIFRPYHEFDGSWFWWGKHFCTREEFVQLWRTTVDYFKNKRKLKNIIYAFSPDRNFHNKKEYLDRYPGDDYVDLFGTDIYYDFTPDGDGLDWITKKLIIITSLAEEKNKLAAFTETGLEGVLNHKWWTDRLLKAIDNDSIKISFVMVWRNANTSHHYAPYVGDESAENFVEFGLTPKIFFEKDLPDLYDKPITDEEINNLGRNKLFEFIRSISLYPIKY